MDFVTSLPISTDWKKNSCDLILVIIDKLTKMIHYKLVKITINDLSLIKIIIDIVMRHYGLLNSIITNRKLLFISKFWSLLCYFLGIKQRLFTAFIGKWMARLRARIA